MNDQFNNTPGESDERVARIKAVLLDASVPGLEST